MVPPFAKTRAGIGLADHLVDLHEVDAIGAQALERLLELALGRSGGAAVELRHEKDAVAVSVRERLAHAALALAAVVVPAVVEERHAMVDRLADDRDRLGLRGHAEVKAPDPEHRDGHARPPEGTHGHRGPGGDLECVGARPAVQRPSRRLASCAR